MSKFSKEILHNQLVLGVSIGDDFQLLLHQISFSIFVTDWDMAILANQHLPTENDYNSVNFSKYWAKHLM